MAVGGVDTYYDYEEKQWKSRRLGGGPIHRGPICPAPRVADHQPTERRATGRDHTHPTKDEKPKPVLN